MPMEVGELVTLLDTHLANGAAMSAPYFTNGPEAHAELIHGILLRELYVGSVAIRTMLQRSLMNPHCDRPFVEQASHGIVFSPRTLFALGLLSLLLGGASLAFNFFTRGWENRNALMVSGIVAGVGIALLAGGAVFAKKPQDET